MLTFGLSKGKSVKAAEQIFFESEIAHDGENVQIIKIPVFI